MTPFADVASLLENAAAQFPDKEAVGLALGPRITYETLDRTASRLRDRLCRLGVKPGDRVGLRLRKSVDAVAAIYGVLKAGAAYVPVDAASPAARAAFIFDDCQVRVLITDRDLANELTGALAARGASPAVLALDSTDGTLSLPSLLDSLDATEPAPRVVTVRRGADDVAYILYTSGSTGLPKGVVLTHGNARSFVDWCSDTFEPKPDDVFSSHAPFHFDLSILDIFVSCKHGARLVLFGEALGKDPLALAGAIASERISVWYSTPSILNFLALFGKLERQDYSALRMVFFAGEVFPIPQFRALKRLWPRPRYFNLYGPTETNVCTFYEVPDDGSWETMTTFPIGRVCPPNEALVVDERDEPVAAGQPGELLISGSNVMPGYWNLPEQNARAFVTIRGRRWYRTGDIVSADDGVEFRYLNRRDRMVKRRGYRVELGEIEAGLSQHPGIREAAAVAVADGDGGVRIAAFVSCAESKLSIIALKTYASKSLPPYMVPDTFKLVDALPRTSTDKVDLKALQSLA